MSAQRPGALDRLRAALDVLIREAAKFGVVGAAAFVVDITTYNLLVFGPRLGSAAVATGPMQDMPLRAKVLSAAVATLVAWLGNRYWTFRRRRRPRMDHELLLFAVFNVIGLGIAVACLGFSRYVLGLDSQLADNVSGNGVGLVLGTLFRFWAYRTHVFKGDALADVDVPVVGRHEHDSDAEAHAGARDQRCDGQRTEAIDT